MPKYKIARKRRGIDFPSNMIVSPTPLAFIALACAETLGLFGAWALNHHRLLQAGFSFLGSPLKNGAGLQSAVSC